VHNTAYEELLAATPPGWSVGQPTFEERRAVPWSMYAFDTVERPNIGRRQREWTAIGPTEEQVIRTMSYCLREIGAGRVPK
jgi:hypothetical protein